MFWKAMMGAALLAVGGSVYHLKGLVLSEDLTNRAILIHGTVVVFPLCVYTTVFGSEERFPKTTAGAQPYRC